MGVIVVHIFRKIYIFLEYNAHEYLLIIIRFCTMSIKGLHSSTERANWGHSFPTELLKWLITGILGKEPIQNPTGRSLGDANSIFFNFCIWYMSQ